MKIATWNVARPAARGPRRVGLLREMEKIAPDVWVLTETRRDFSPGAGYRLIAWSADVRNQVSMSSLCWVAIWSRRPAVGLTMAADPLRTAGVKVEKDSGGALLIIGTVLPWLGDTSQSGYSGSAGFCAALSSQAAEWDTLCSVHGGDSLCVAGDFNQDLAPRHYYGSRRGRAALRTALDERGLRCLTAGDQDPVWRDTDRAAASVDHICVSATSRAAIGGVWPMVRGGVKLSDHFGVWVEIH